MSGSQGGRARVMIPEPRGLILAGDESRSAPRYEMERNRVAL